MATNNRGVDYADLWAMYKRQREFLKNNPDDSTAKRYVNQIEHWMDLTGNLPILSYKTQLEVLDNCPMDIIKAHAHLLHDEAKKRLGLEVKTRKTKQNFDFYGIFG